MRRLTLALCGHDPFARRDPPVRGPAAESIGWKAGSTTCCRIAGPPTTWPNGSPAPWSAPRMGPFVQFRRRRFTTWLSDAILANRPYDAVVRDLVADQGLWTDHPATNFVSVTFSEETKLPDPERLAARVSRAFLGVRIDCAQCHDHPFQPWKQADFRGLAAFFGGVYSSLRGIRDQDNAYQPLDRKTKEPVKVEPRVPFLPELLPASRAACASGLPAGSSTRPIPTSREPRSTASGPSSSAARWSSRSTTCPSRASFRLRFDCWPTTSRRTVTTCTG